MVGAILSLCLIAVSGLFLWDVRVEGSESIPEGEVLEALAEAGLSAGRFLPLVDRDAIALSVRRRDARFAFVSVNLRGTVAYVQIREALPQPSERAPAPANLVAARDGVVTLPLIFEGQTLVREGDVVRAGQILASGVIDSEKHGYRITRAAGQVFARTVHTYTVTVPLVYEEKTSEGRAGYEISAFFFGFNGKILKTTGNSYINCDIIQNTNYITLPDGTPLPMGFTVTQVIPYGLRTATRSVTEARALACAELERRLAAQGSGRVTLSRTVEVVADAESVTLTCTLVCEEDIALTAELAYVPNSSERTFYEPRDRQNRKQ
jgi:similar to stage IV sporulation protein